MNEQANRPNRLAALHIELPPFPDTRSVEFSADTGSGAPMKVAVSMQLEEFQNFGNTLASIASKELLPPQPFAFGHGDGDRIQLGFDLYVAPHYVLTVAIEYSANNYKPTTFCAQVSEAALARLRDTVKQVAADGAGTVAWTIHD